MRDDRLALARTLAQRGGEAAMRLFRRVGYQHKEADERVTEADHAVQRLIHDGVRAAFPGDGFIGEEAEDVAIFKERPDAEFCWIVDPIDGTNNFTIGLPFFCVSIGVFRRGEPHIGVVHDPCRGETYHARIGGGAFRDGEPIRVIADPLGPNTHFGLPSLIEPPLPAYAIGWFERHKCRDLGAIALQMAYVAAGCLHWTVGFRSKLWDIAAAAALVVEAGGRITALDGSPLFPSDLTAEAGRNIPVLASNGSAHHTLLAQIAGK